MTWWSVLAPARSTGWAHALPEQLGLMAFSWSALLGFVWIVLVSIVALMPFPQHKPYALALLLLFPVLLVAIGIEWGWLFAAAFFIGALSIYRHPARYLLRQMWRRDQGGGMIYSWPLVLGLSWLVIANVIAMFPSPVKHHWPAAYVLIAVGLPLLVWIGMENGVLIAILFLVAGASVLRWPVRFLLRWLKRRMGRAHD